MQCAEFENRLHGLLDARVPPENDPPLIAHAAACDACGSVLRVQKQLFASLRAPVTEKSTIEFSHTVIDRVSVNRRRTHHRRIAASVIAAAAVLLVIVLPFAGRPPQVVEQDGGSGRKVMGLTTVAPRSVPQQLSKEEAEEFRALIRHLVDEISQRRLQALEPVDHLSDGFRPLAVTFNIAFDALWKTLPGHHSAVEHEPPQAFNPAELSPLT